MLEQEGYTERLDTLTLLRFLRARKFNVELSKQMFIKNEQWRKEFGVDDLVRNFDYKEKPQVFQYYPQYYHKTDKDGRPVYIEQYGKIDLNAMYKITTAEHGSKSRCRIRESCRSSTPCLLAKVGQIARDMLHHHGHERSRRVQNSVGLRLPEVCQRHLSGLLP